MMEESSVNRNDVVTLTDEEGQEHDFAVIDAFVVDEKRYAILLPAYDDGEEEEIEVDVEEDAYIFRIEIDEDSGEETLTEVDDEKEWERVATAWEDRLDDLDELDDDEEEDDGEDFF